MSCRTLIVLILALCVSLAPTVSVVAMTADDGTTLMRMQDPSADCHAAGQAAGQSRAANMRQDAPDHETKVSHACCASILGIPAQTLGLEGMPGSQALTPANASLRLISRVEGIYRPPPASSR